jgi:hypothetical protein
MYLPWFINTVSLSRKKGLPMINMEVAIGLLYYADRDEYTLAYENALWRLLTDTQSIFYAPV